MNIRVIDFEIVLVVGFVLEAFGGSHLGGEGQLLGMRRFAREGFGLLGVHWKLNSIKIICLNSAIINTSNISFD